MNRVVYFNVSRWLVGPAMALLVGLGVVVTRNGSWYSALPLLAPLTLILWLLYRTNYEIQPERQLLLVVSGLFAWQIPITSITREEATEIRPVPPPSPSTVSESATASTIRS